MRYMKSCPISDQHPCLSFESICKPHVQAKPGSTRELIATIEVTEVNMNCSNRVTLGVLLLSVLTLYGCEDLVIRDTSSCSSPGFKRSEILGLLAGFGTTFAAVPDLVAMLKRRSSAGMNARMAGIMGVFQIAWSTTAC